MFILKYNWKEQTYYKEFANETDARIWINEWKHEIGSLELYKKFGKI